MNWLEFSAITSYTHRPKCDIIKMARDARKGGILHEQAFFYLHLWIWRLVERWMIRSRCDVEGGKGRKAIFTFCVMIPYHT